MPVIRTISGGTSPLILMSEANESAISPLTIFNAATSMISLQDGSSPVVSVSTTM
jgi:hypothetical protein